MALQKNNNKTAFSLLELSVVLVIISILTGVIANSSYLVNLAKLNSARNITKSSVARNISGMVLWLDAVSSAGFDSDFIDDGSLVSKWHDIKNSYLEPYVAVQDNGENRPIYRDSILSKLPAISFDGNDFLTIPKLQTNGYLTIFVVGQFTQGASFFIEQSENSNVNNGFYFNGNGNAPANIGRDSDSSAANNINWFGSNPAIAVMRYDGTNISYKKNDGAFVNTADPDAANNIAIGDLFIGSRAGTANFTNGSFGEIIIYDRALTNVEVDKVIEYLNTKWDIY